MKSSSSNFMKWKMTGLTFALAVTMILSVSVYAEASPYSFYEKIIAQEGKLGVFHWWPDASKIELISWMQDANIEVDQTVINKLQDSTLTESEKAAVVEQFVTDFYPSRDSTLTSIDIIAKEKGPIETWSLEDKNWVSDVQSIYQPSEVAYGRNLLPNDNDLSQADAETIFFSYYEKKYDLKLDDFDHDSMTVFFGENTYDDGAQSVLLRRWVININVTNEVFQERNLTIQDVGAEIGSDGTIISITELN